MQWILDLSAIIASIISAIALLWLFFLQRRAKQGDDAEAEKRKQAEVESEKLRNVRRHVARLSHEMTVMKSGFDDVNELKAQVGVMNQSLTALVGQVTALATTDELMSGQLREGRLFHNEIRDRLARIEQALEGRTITRKRQ